jgi:CheY-like chemotaxis protein
VKRVLLVDDDDDLREALATLLALGGYDVEGAASGAEALAWLRCHVRPDIILLDLMMPGMTGAELKGRLDSDARLCAIPVVVLSGDTRVADQAAAMGAAGWVVKPASFDTLVQVLRRVA